MRMLAVVLIALAVEGFVASTSAAQSTCVGNCNHDSEVTVDELLIMVNVALGSADVSRCLAGDANYDGDITVDEILAAVNNALLRCVPPTETPGALPTPTPPPPTPTPVPTSPAAVKACDDDCRAAQRKCGDERFSEQYDSLQGCTDECVNELDDFASDAADYQGCASAQVRFIQCCTAKGQCGEIPGGCDSEFVGAVNACGGQFGGCPLIFF